MTKTQIANLAISFVGGRSLENVDLDTSQQAIACRNWFDAARDECLASHPWNFAVQRHRASVIWLSLSGAALANNGSGLIRVTHTAHGLVTGDRIHMRDTQGVQATGSWYVTRINDNAFDLQGSTFTGTYVNATGSWVKAPRFGWAYQFALPSDCLAVRNVNGAQGNEEDSIPYEVEGGYLLADCDVLELRYTFRHVTTADWPQIFVNSFALLLASYIAQDLTGPAGKAAELRAQYEQSISPKAKGRDSRQGKGRVHDPDYDSRVVRARRGFGLLP